MFCILDKLHSSLISICIETKIWRPLATLTYCAHLWVRRVPKKAVETNLTLVEHSGSRDAAQILFQMDHCPAMFDNCHRYQYDGPSKNGQTKLDQIQRGMWQNQKSYVLSFQACAQKWRTKPGSTFMSKAAQLDLAIAGGEFMQHFLPPAVIRPNVFMPTGLSSAKCIAPPLKCIAHTNVLMPRLALNESLVQPPC